MKRSKNFFSKTALLLLLLTNPVQATEPDSAFCGFDYAGFEYYYYSHLEQSDFLKEKKLGLFLYCSDAPFCENYEPNQSSLNIQNWQGFLGGSLSTEEVTELVYNKAAAWYDDLLQNPKKAAKDAVVRKISPDRRKAFFIYMHFTAKAAKVSSNRNRGWNTWRQGERKIEEDNKPELLEEATALMNRETFAFLKARYVFQMVRLAHYMQEAPMALRYFDNLMERQPGNEYIYYRALEQRSGAAFNLQKHREATEGFLEVFENLPERARNNALSLRMMDWNYMEENNIRFTGKQAAALHFFKAYFSGGSLEREMERLQALDPTATYLEILALRETAKLQQSLFSIHEDRSWWGGTTYQEQETDKEKAAFLEKLAGRQINTPQVIDKDFWKTVQALAQMGQGRHLQAEKTLQSISSKSRCHSTAKRLLFATKVLEIAQPDSPAIDPLFHKLKKDSDLYQSTMTPYFFNHIAGLYYRQGNQLMGHLGYLRDRAENPDTWEKATENVGSYWLYSDKYELLDEAALEAFKQLLDKPDKTAYEQLVLSKLKGDPSDYYHDLAGTLLFSENRLDAAIAHFEKIKKPNDFYGDYYRPQLFAGAIREYFDSDFEERSDRFHQTHPELFDDVPRYKSLLGEDSETYPDNKLKLARLLKKMEAIADQNGSNAADYYYMLGNAWYNLSERGWFVNTLHYVGNNSRNSLIGSYERPIDAAQSESTFKEIATTYFNKAIEASGSKEVKAKAVFMLAKTNYCYWQPTHKNSYRVAVCGDHRAYFQTLKDHYSDTQFEKEVIKECSWYRVFLGM